jgi:hypothetical protein
LEKEEKGLVWKLKDVTREDEIELTLPGVRKSTIRGIVGETEVKTWFSSYRIISSSSDK